VHLLALVEKNHEAEVADALLEELGAGDQLEALHLPPVRRVPEHVDEEELRHVAVAQLVALLLERRADRRALLVDARALVGLRLAGPHVSYQLAQPDRHRRRSKTVHAAAKGACGWGKES
jgi:hypothetical protein